MKRIITSLPVTACRHTPNDGGSQSCL